MLFSFKKMVVLKGMFKGDVLMLMGLHSYRTDVDKLWALTHFSALLVVIVTVKYKLHSSIADVQVHVTLAHVENRHHQDVKRSNQDHHSVTYDVKYPKPYYWKSRTYPDRTTGRQTNPAKWSVKRVNEPRGKQGMKSYIPTTTEMCGWVMRTRGYICSHDDTLRVAIILATRNVVIGYPFLLTGLIRRRTLDWVDLNAQIKNLFFAG